MKRRNFIITGAATMAAPYAGRALAEVASESDDMAVLRGALAMHPGLMRYLTPGRLDSGLAALSRSWQVEPTLEARYLALSGFLATIRCGHSYANFYNQKRAVAEALFDRPTRLPFHFLWIGDAMVVTNGFATGLSRGTVIEELNGEAPHLLRARLMTCVRADGHNDAKRVSLLEVRGDDTIETFDVFQGLIAPPVEGRHRILARTPDGVGRRLTLPAIGIAARKAQMAQDARSEADPVWQWRMTETGVAVVTMPSWALWDSKWDWKGWLDERLDGLAGSRGLIVDLRNNEGGADCGDAILARLITRDFMPPQVQQRLRFRQTSPALDPYLDTWDDSFRKLGEKATPLAGGFYLRPAGEDMLVIKPAGRPIQCPVRVLTSPVNSSATFQFAGNLRAIGGGKLVGRPTGGNRRGINGGCFFFVRLPQSGIEFDLPLVGYFPTVPQPDAGILPDLAAADTIDSIAAGNDPTLEAALRSIG